MSYTPFYINPQLTETGYQKLFVQGVQVSIAEIAMGAANGTSGYATAFRDSRTALMDEKQRKQVGASQAEDATDDDGNPFRRIDYATMFTGNDNYDAWEIGFFDTDGDLIYVWSATTGLAFVPIRINLDIAVLLAQYLTMQEEITNVTVVDSGYPFELFVGALTDGAAAMIAAHEQRVAAHEISQIKGLQTALDTKLTESQGNNLYVKLTQFGAQATDEEVAAAVLQHLQVSDPHPQYSKRFAATDALPTVDIGVIWHDAYASLMHWVTLSNNGYEYDGYASINLGEVTFFDKPTPPAGWLKSNGATTGAEFAALNAFRGSNILRDMRGEFIRGFDDGRGVDLGRVFGQWQSATHHMVADDTYSSSPPVGSSDFSQFGLHGWELPTIAQSAVSGSPQVAISNVNAPLRTSRPRNIALLPCIKY